MAYTTARLNSALDAANSGAAWAQLHTDSPGGAGTSNIATQSSPAAITGFSGASSGTDSGTCTFTITGAEGPYRFVSLWTNSGGSPDVFIGSGALTPEETFAGPGSLEVTIT